jgi:hypothetical protein
LSSPVRCSLYFALCPNSPWFPILLGTKAKSCQRLQVCYLSIITFLVWLSGYSLNTGTWGLLYWLMSLPEPLPAEFFSLSVLRHPHPI